MLGAEQVAVLVGAAQKVGVELVLELEAALVWGVEDVAVHNRTVYQPVVGTPVVLASAVLVPLLAAKDS